MQTPHLRIVFSEDAQEWDKYVTDCLSRCIQTNAATNSQLNVQHEKLENVQCSNSQSESQSSHNSQVICILILSPGVLQLLRLRPSLAEHIRSLGTRTVCILCGVRRSELLQRLQQSEIVTNVVSGVSFNTLQSALQWMHLWHMLDAEQQSEQLLPQLLLVIGRLLRQQQHQQPHQLGQQSKSFFTSALQSNLIAQTSSFSCTNSVPMPNINTTTTTTTTNSSFNCSNVATSLNEEGEVYSLLSALTSGQPIQTSLQQPQTSTSAFSAIPSLSISSASSSCSSSGVSSVSSQLSTNVSLDKPAFKLSPRKVTSDNCKVLILLKQPLASQDQPSIQVHWNSRCLRTSDSSSTQTRHVCVKTLNPYTLQFKIPDDLLSQSRELTISLLVANDTNQNDNLVRCVGQRPLKCECRQAQLSCLLNGLSSPIDYLQQAFNCSSLADLDTCLSERLQQQVPASIPELLGGLSQPKPIEQPLIDLLDDCVESVQIDQDASLTTTINDDETKCDDQNSKCDKDEGDDCQAKKVTNSSTLPAILPTDSSLETPSLLHFAARFGLIRLAQQLIQIAGESIAVRLCAMRNARGLNALQLAHRSKHTRLVQLLRPHMETWNVACDNVSIDLELCEEPLLPLLCSKSPQPRPDSGASGLSSNTDESILSGDERMSLCRSPLNLAASELQQQQQQYCNLGSLTKTLGAVDLSSSSSLPRMVAGDYDVLVCEKPRKAHLPPPLPVGEVKLQANSADVVDGKRNLYVNSELFPATNSTTVNEDVLDDGLKSKSSGNTSESKQTSLSESQLELVEIMNAFKYGSHSIEQIEDMFKCWQAKYKINVTESSTLISGGHERSSPSSTVVTSSTSTPVTTSGDEVDGLKRRTECNKPLRKTPSLDSIMLRRRSPDVNTMPDVKSARAQLNPINNRGLADWLHQLAAKLRHKSSTSSSSLKLNKNKDKLVKSTSLLSGTKINNNIHPLPSKNSLMLRGARLAELRQKNVTLPAGSKPLSAKELNSSKSMTLPATISNGNIARNTLAKVHKATVDSSLMASSSITTTINNSCDSSWNLYTLDEDRKTIICNSRNKPTIGNVIAVQKNSTGKQPMPPPTSDYDRVPLGPPIPVPKRVNTNNGLSNNSTNPIGAF